MSCFEERRRFPDFGKEVKRDFEVCAPCYDCRKFYKKGKDACKGQQKIVNKKWKCSRVDWFNIIKAG